MKSAKRALAGPLLVLAAVSSGLLSAPALAEFDLSGEWAPRYHEDFPERIPGPSIGEYHGIPINEEARARGEAWDADLLTVPEHQCQPHPADYATRGPSNLRIWTQVDSDTQKLLAIKIRFAWPGTERTIWVDGRKHPPAYAAHTWQGFSTGEWHANRLDVTTTHLKQGWLRRNGLPRSDKAVLREHFARYGNYLTIISIVQDPAFLEEPFIRSQNWVLTPAQVIGPYTCDPAEEVDRPEHAVPHFLPGRNPYLKEYAERYGLSMKAAMGGPATMYPDFIE